MFLHIKWSCKPPLRLYGNNIYVTHISYITLSSVFETNEVPFQTAKPLFNDILAFFMTAILSIKLIVVYVLSKAPQNSAQCFLMRNDNWSIITNLGSQVHAIIFWWFATNDIDLGHWLMRPVYRGCLYSNFTQWFLDLRPDFRLDRVRISQE